HSDIRPSASTDPSCAKPFFSVSQYQFFLRLMSQNDHFHTTALADRRGRYGILNICTDTDVDASIPPPSDERTRSAATSSPLGGGPAMPFVPITPFPRCAQDWLWPAHLPVGPSVFLGCDP